MIEVGEPLSCEKSLIGSAGKCPSRTKTSVHGDYTIDGPAERSRGFLGIPLEGPEPNLGAIDSMAAALVGAGFDEHVGVRHWFTSRGAR